MKQTIVKGSNLVPEITFDQNSGEISIEGWSFSERPSQIFDPIFQIIQENSEKLKRELFIRVKLYCMNTASSKCLVQMAELLRKDTSHFYGKFIWHYDEQDEETKEWGEDIAIISGVPFDYLPYQSN